MGYIKLEEALKDLIKFNLDKSDTTKEKIRVFKNRLIKIQIKRQKRN